MTDRDQRRQMELVVRRVMKTAQKYDQIGKPEFESILDLLQRQVRKNTGIEMDVIRTKTAKVLSDLPKEYGQINKASRSWELLIAYLYGKYLTELGVIKAA
jgi:hypothetical protein